MDDIRRLYRSQTERMLFGVCGGLGQYLTVDPTIVRLVFIALAFATGPGALIAYLVLALVVPEAPMPEAE